MRKSDQKMLAAKCVPLIMPNINSELLETYLQREISVLKALNSSYVMKIEDTCFITDRVPGY